MIVSAHQPSYFPWLGWLHKVSKSDTFILMDEVQLSDKSYQHRNLFLSNSGKVKYLTIPFEKKGYMEKTIGQLKLNPQVKWQKNHFNFIKENYRKHPYYEEIIDKIEPLYQKDFDSLIEVLNLQLDLVFSLFDLKAELLYQSQLDYNRQAVRNELVLELVKAVKGNTYLSGVGAKDYLIEDEFNKEGIKVTYQDFKHPNYKQFGQDDFIPGLNCLDLLFNLGIEQSRDFLKNIP